MKKLSMPGSFSVRRTIAIGTLSVAALWLSGCASLNPQTPEDVVRQRVEERWNTLIDGNFEKAWTFSSPSFKALVKQSEYRQRFGGAGRWKGIQVHDVKCEPERCKVKIRLTTVLDVPPAVGQEIVGYIEEVWVREEGQWWYYEAL